MKVRKMIQRLSGRTPLFPVIPILPMAIVLGEAVFAVLNFQRLKRLERRVARPIQSNGRAARVARAHA